MIKSIIPDFETINNLIYVILGSMNQEISVKPGQRLKVKIDNSKIQDTEIDNIIEAVKPYNKKEPVLSLKTKKTLTEELFNYEMEA